MGAEQLSKKLHQKSLLQRVSHLRLQIKSCRQNGSVSSFGTKPTCLYVRYSVATGWKADFEQAASVIVLCARQGASLRRRRSSAGAIRSLFQLMGSSVGYLYRRGRGCL